MNQEEIKSQLRNIIETRLDIDVAGLEVDDDSGLFDDSAWGIDSIDVLDIVLGIDQVFGVKIRQDDDVARHFESINTLSAYIHEQLTATSA